MPATKRKTRTKRTTASSRSPAKQIAEGLHATAWAGQPLASPRRWHAYYYLGYDVDPTCNESEYTPDSSGVPGGI